MSTMNRLGNCHNKYQGDNKRVLCVCSAGLLRSPTAAWVLSNPPYNYNTRAVGVSDEYALIPVDEVLIEWADEIVCMEHDHAIALEERFGGILDNAPNPVIILGVPDKYGFRDRELIEFIQVRYKELTGNG